MAAGDGIAAVIGVCSLGTRNTDMGTVPSLVDVGSVKDQFPASVVYPEFKILDIHAFGAEEIIVV